MGDLDAAIANGPCVKVLRGASYTCGPHGMKHPECAAAAARAVVEQEARRVLATLPRYTHPHDAITALLAALGGDQATDPGGDDG